MLSSLLAALPFLLAGASDGAWSATASDEVRVLDAMRQGGVVVLIRHSETVPGVGDPPGFQLADCATQRNLGDAGRAQARRLGQWFKANGLVPTVVRASPWCRTRETAMLAFGQSEEWAPLSNLLPDRSRQDDHARHVRGAIAGVGGEDIVVLVSHGVTINAFVGAYLSQGEMVVVRPGKTASGNPGVEVLGRLLVQ